MATKPVTKGYLTSPFGWRTLNGKQQFHGGIDIGSHDEFPPIVSAYKSRIVVQGWSDSFGWRVWAEILEGDNTGMFVVYAHMLKLDPNIKDNQNIEEGTLLGIMGNTGWSEGRHLHFEIRTKPTTAGRAINPTEISKLYA